MAALFGKKFDGNKVKVNLKMSVNRFNLLTQKKANLAKQQKRQVALLLRDDKEANARILVEHIIREDYALESYELLKQYCELLLARLNVLTTEPDLKPEIAEAVCSLLYGGYLMGTDIPELKTLNTMFTAKYGKPYADEVIQNKEKYLNHRLLRMLTSTSVPDSSVTELYLTEIAKAYGVQFTPRPSGSIPAPINSSTLGVPLPLPGQALPAQPAGSDAGSDASGAIPPIVPSIQGGGGNLYPGPVPEPPQPKPACGTASAPVAGVPLAPLGASEQPSMDLTALMGGGQPAANVPLVVTLTKSTQGFGMTLDHDNVVLAVKPFSQAETSGVVQPGDKVVLLNNVPITPDRPVKSVAIDLPDGAPATFHLVRGASSSSVASFGEANASALPPAPDAGASLLDVQVPPPQGEVLPPSGPATNTLPARADGRVESEDDALARRLEMLKRA